MLVTLTSNADLAGDAGSYIDIQGLAIVDRAVREFARTSGVELAGPAGLAVLGGTLLFVVDPGVHSIVLINLEGSTATSVEGMRVGSGNPGFLDGPVSSARFRNPTAVAFAPGASVAGPIDASVEAVIVDSGNHLIRKLTMHGAESRVDTLAGLLPVNSVPTTGGADGPGFNEPTDAVFAFVSGILRVIVADAGNHRLKMIDVLTGEVSTLAGSGKLPGLVDGPASSAEFNFPQGLAVTASGLIIVADAGNHAIRTLDLSSHTLEVATLAGSRVGASGMLDGVGAAAAFNTPHGIAMHAEDTAVVAGKPHTLDPKPLTPSPKPYALNPEPYILIPEHSTLIPKP